MYTNICKTCPKCATGPGATKAICLSIEEVASVVERASPAQPHSPLLLWMKKKMAQIHQKRKDSPCETHPTFRPTGAYCHFYLVACARPHLGNPSLVCHLAAADHVRERPAALT